MAGPSTAGLPGSTRPHLVARVRTLLGSLSSGYTDADIRAYLDQNMRAGDGYARLLGWTSSGSVAAVFGAGLGNWDEGWVVDPTFPGSPAVVVADLIAGRWTVSNAPLTWTPPDAIRVQGVIYDVYGASADALQRETAARVVEFTTSGGETIRTADSTQLITEYRSRAWAASVVLDRGDLYGDDVWPGDSWGSRWI